MKDSIILAIVEKWESEARLDRPCDGSPSAQINNAREDGINEGKLHCCRQLRNLVDLLGGDDSRNLPSHYPAKIKYPDNQP